MLSVDNSNIDASHLNRGKLHLNRQGTLILADNFKKSLASSGWFDESFLNNDGTLDCICINPNTSIEADFTVTLKLNHSKYLKNLTFSHLNINSIRNKFENLKEVVSNHVNILVTAEAKIDKSFPMAQFLMEGFHKPLRLDISDKSGGFLVYVRLHLLSRQLIESEIPSEIQAIPFEVNMRKKKWFF